MCIMAVVFFNHHTLFPLASGLTRDNWRQIILPDFLCVYIFLCLSPKLSVSWSILRTLLVYDWYVWAASAFFVSDYYPDHKKAPALIVIATYTVLLCFSWTSVCFCVGASSAEVFLVFWFAFALTGIQVCTY